MTASQEMDIFTWPVHTHNLQHIYAEVRGNHATLYTGVHDAIAECSSWRYWHVCYRNLVIFLYGAHLNVPIGGKQDKY
jgi:hypothetical protein